MSNRAELCQSINPKHIEQYSTFPENLFKLPREAARTPERVSFVIAWVYICSGLNLHIWWTASWSMTTSPVNLPMANHTFLL